MEGVGAPGTLESGKKYPPWYFFPQVFFRKLAGKNAKEGLDGHGVPDTVDERGALQKEIKRKNFTPMKFSIILELYRRFYLNLKTRM